MRLDDFDPSENVRDLGDGGGRGGFGGPSMGGLFGLLPLLLGRKMGCGTIILLGVLAFVFFSSGGLNLGGPTGGGSGVQEQQQAGVGNAACDTQAELFACRVLAATEQTWGRIFQQQGERYTPATLNFFTQSGQSGCGAAQSAMGPFYCPADQGIYLDTDFFRELEQRFQAAGDFAQAYVISHEVGHHIQTITGISNQVRSAQQRASEAEGNALQVRMELQADCYAGVWARNTVSPKTGAPVMEPGDLEEGLRAANAIGDDTLQRSAGQRPVPESFTHGTSEQRMRWLKRGYDTGDWKKCDTFAAQAL